MFPWMFSPRLTPTEWVTEPPGKLLLVDALKCHSIPENSPATSPVTVNLYELFDSLSVRIERTIFDDSRSKPGPNITIRGRNRVKYWWKNCVGVSDD